MKTSEILEFWKNAVPEGWKNTCDIIWYPVEKDIRRCAVCFKLTPENLKQADELCCAFYTQACRELGLNKSILVLGHCESA